MKFRGLTGAVAMVAATTVASAVGPAAPAGADWLSAASGPVQVLVASLPAATAPAAAGAASAVTVSWAPVAFPGPPLSYVVRRYDSGGRARVVGGGCSGRIPTPDPAPDSLSCTESSVPAGTWTYTVTPALASWLGGESDPSPAVTVSGTEASVAGTYGVEQYQPGGCGSVSGVALVTAGATCSPALLRQNNPGALVLAYVHGETCGTAACPADPNDPQYARDLSGNRIPGSSPNTYLMQIDNSTWMNADVAACLSAIQIGFDGCFLDQMGSGAFSLGNIAVPGTSPPIQYTGTQWAALATQLYQYVRSSVPAGTHLLANGLSHPQCATPAGCPTNGFQYSATGLIVDNSGGTDFAAAMENFPGCGTLARCTNAKELSDWHTATTAFPAGAEHVAVIDHAGGAPVPHETALALFLLADQDPAHMYWSYCTATTDPACKHPDQELLTFSANALTTSGRDGTNGYRWLGDSGNGVFHTSWTNGDCFVNTNRQAVSMTIPGSPGAVELELNGQQDTGGAPFSLGPNSGMCWSAA